jgi:hypothetical protein
MGNDHAQQQERCDKKQHYFWVHERANDDPFQKSTRQSDEAAVAEAAAAQARR